MPAIYIQHYQQFFDKNGRPLTGGKLFTYQAGTNVLKPTFTSESGLTQHPNPIILNGEGKPETGPIFVSGSYRYELLDCNDNFVSGATVDNVSQVLTRRDFYDLAVKGYRSIETLKFTAGQFGDFKKEDYPDMTAIIVTCVGAGGNSGSTSSFDNHRYQSGNTVFGSLVIGEGGFQGDSVSGPTAPEANNGMGGSGGGGIGDIVIKGQGGGGSSRGIATVSIAGAGGNSAFGGGEAGVGYQRVVGPNETDGPGIGGGAGGRVIEFSTGNYRSSCGGGGGGTAKSLIKREDLPTSVYFLVGEPSPFDAEGMGGGGLLTIEILGAGAVSTDGMGPIGPSKPIGQLAWEKNSPISPMTAYLNGFKIEKFNMFDNQEIWTIVNVPEGHEAGHQITLQNGQAFGEGVGNLLFKAESWLLRDGMTDIINPGGSHNSTNTEMTIVNSNQLTAIPSLDITNSGGVIDGNQVIGGDRILVKLYRDNDNVAVSPLEADAGVLMSTFEVNLGAL